MKYGFSKLSAIVAVIGMTMSSAYAADEQNSQIDLRNAPQMQSSTDKNKNQSEAFLAANKTKPGVVTLPDGLQYKIIDEGKGEKPQLTDTVTVHYVGTLIDGTEFDSSYKHGKPMTFAVTDVIPGWVEALQLMKEGSTWQLFIPASLAYGEQGAPPTIAPNSTLVFTVKLLAIKKS